MLLKIENFRIWKKVQVEFKEGKINLIVGDNGIGKSNILEALQWVLYGKQKNITPWDLLDEKNNKKENTRTKVIFKWNKIRITRCSGPTTLEVINGDIRIKAKKDAQEYIDLYFKTNDIMAIGSYIKQKDYNLFLSESQASRQKLLAVMATKNEENEDLKTVKTEMDKTNIDVSVLNREYERMLDKEVDGDVEDILDEETLLKCKDDMEKFSKQIIEVEADIKINQQLHTQINQVKKKLSNLEAPENPIKPSVLITENEYNHELKAIDLKAKLDNVEKQLVKDTLDEEAYITLIDNLKKDLIQHKIWEQKQKEQTNILTKYKLTLSRVDDRIKVINEYIEQKDNIKFFEELETLEREQSSYNNKIKNLNFKVNSDIEALNNSDLVSTKEPKCPDVSHIESQISDLKQKLKLLNIVLSCPHCQNKLLLVNNTLKSANIPSEDNINDIKKQISDLESQEDEIVEQFDQERKQWHKRETLIKNHSTYMSKSALYNEYNMQIEKINPRIHELRDILKQVKKIDLKQIEALKQELDALNKLDTNVYNPKVKEISRNIEDYEDTLALLIRKKELLSKQLPRNYTLDKNKLKTAYEATLKYNKALSMYENQRIKYETEFSSLTKQLESLKPQLKTIKNDPDAIKARLERRKAFIKNHKLGLLKQAEENKRSEIETERNLKQLEYQDFLRFYAKAKQADFKTYIKFISRVNDNIAYLLKDLFPDPIVVQLSVEKELKSGIIRPNVGLVIFYKGQNVDFNQKGSLSEGQKDRISLALTLAFNQELGLPFLILDESFAFFDSEVSITAIDTIRNHFPELTVIVVKHEATEGLYDCIIDAEALSKSQ